MRRCTDLLIFRLCDPRQIIAPCYLLVIILVRLFISIVVTIIVESIIFSHLNIASILTFNLMSQYRLLLKY